MEKMSQITQIGAQPSMPSSQCLGSANGHCQPLPHLPLLPASSLGHMFSGDGKEHQVPLVRMLGDPGRQQAGGQDTSPVAQGLGTKVSVMNYSPELC